jgi:hypothetical protein
LIVNSADAIDADRWRSAIRQVLVALLKAGSSFILAAA